MRSRFLLALGGLGLALFPAFASAQTACRVLPASQDNTLFESATGDLSSGVGPRGIFGGTGQGWKRRYLVQFDVAGAIPAGSTIENVTLHLHALALSGQGGPVFFQSVHRVDQAWGEGSSNSGNSGQGAPATPGDATWIHAVQPGSLWLAPGGDYDAVASLDFSLDTLGPFEVGSSGLTADAQAWLDQPATNFGWLIKGVSEGPSTTVAVGSREALDPAHVPLLRVEYTPPAGTITTFCDPAPANSSGLPVVATAQFGVGGHSGLHLEATQGPPQLFGYFLVGTKHTEVGVPLSAGRLCLDAQAPQRIGRYNIANTEWNSTGVFDGAGVLQNAVGTSTTGSGFDVPSALPFSLPQTIQAGDTWHFQLWYRDLGGTSNLSNGLSVTF